MITIKHNFFKFILCFIFGNACQLSDNNQITKLVKHFVIEIKQEIKLPILINADTSYLETLFKNYELTNINNLDSSIKIDLKYADTNNFLHINFYDGLRKAYFPCEVANRLCNAQFFLKQQNKNFSLIIFDATRPLHLQQLMWDSLKIESNLKYNYLAPPFQESLHNYGCAVDVGIIDITTNKLLDMGTNFDSFNKLSQPVYEFQFLKTGELSKNALENRKLLRKVMHLANFYGITSEWWHFNYCTKEQAILKFKLVK